MDELTRVALEASTDALHKAGAALLQKPSDQTAAAWDAAFAEHMQTLRRLEGVTDV